MNKNTKKMEVNSNRRGFSANVVSLHASLHQPRSAETINIIKKEGGVSYAKCALKWYQQNKD
jgi:hypothetical protein